MITKLDFNAFRFHISPPTKQPDVSQTPANFVTSENAENSSPLYFGARQYSRTVLTEEERTKRAQEEKLAASQWAKMPLLFQVAYPKPGQKISFRKMTDLQTRLDALPQISSHPSVREAMAASFSPTAPTSPLKNQERTMLDQVALLLDMARNETNLLMYGSHPNENYINLWKGIENPVLRDSLITQMATDAAIPARIIGAKLLGLLSNPQQQQELAQQLLDDPDETVQISAIPSIILFPTDSQKAELILEAAEKPGRARAMELAKVIGSLEDKTTQVNLIRQMSRSPNTHVRFVAVSSSQHLPRGPQTDALLEKLCADPSDMMCEKAIQVAVGKESPIASAPVRDRIIINGLGDERPEIQESVAFFVTSISDEHKRLELGKKLVNNGIIPGNTNFIPMLAKLPDEEKAKLIRKGMQNKGKHFDLAKFLKTIKNDRIQAALIPTFCAQASSSTVHVVSDILKDIEDERLRANTLKRAISMRASHLSPNAYKNRIENFWTVSFAPLIASFDDAALRTEIMDFLLQHPAAVVREEALTDKVFLPEFQEKIIATLKNDPSPFVRAQVQKRDPALYTQKERQQTLKDLFNEKDNTWALYEGARLVVESRNSALQARVLPAAIKKIVAELVGSDLSSYPAPERLRGLFKDWDQNIVVPEVKKQLATLFTSEEDASSVNAEAILEQINTTDDSAEKTALLKQWMHFCLKNAKGTTDTIQQQIIPSINAFLEDVPYLQIVDQAIPQLQALMTEAMNEQRRNGKARDGEKAFLSHAIPLLSQPGALSEAQLLGTFKTLSILGLDARALPQALAELARFRLHALRVREQFAANGRAPMSEQALKHYLDGKTDILLQGILVAGEGAMLDKFNQRQERFELFLEGLTRVLQDDDLTKRLYQIHDLPDRQGRQDAYQKAKLVEYIYGFLALGEKEALLPLLDDMIAKGSRDLGALGKKLVQVLALQVGLSPQEAQMLSTEQLEAFNPDYLHTIPQALRTDELYGPRSDSKPEQMKHLIKSTLQGTYSSLLHNPDTAFGRVNLKTREAFQQAGLNYELWLNYPKVHSFSIQMPNGKIHEMEVKMWDRKPGYDLFQGNYAQACTAMGAFSSRALVDALLYTSVQMPEIRDKTLDKTVGKVQTVWVKDEQTGKPLLLADNIQLASPYRKVNGMLEGIRPFMRQLGNDVANQPTQALVGELHNEITQIEELPTTSLTFHMIGDTNDHKLFLNAFPDSDTHRWQDIRKSRQLTLCKL